MNKEELKEYLKENLKIEVSVSYNSRVGSGSKYHGDSPM